MEANEGFFGSTLKLYRSLGSVISVGSPPQNLVQMVAGKSFSSRFVSQVKPESQSAAAAAAAMSKVVRRKKSGLVDDHFQAIIPAVCDKKVAPVHEDSPPPCNCPRHFPKPSQVISNKPSQEIAKGPTAAAASTTSRHRLKTGGDADILGKIDKLLNCRDIIARRLSSPRRARRPDRPAFERLRTQLPWTI